MTVHLPYLLVAIALLWLPRAWLRWGPSLRRRRGRSIPQSWTHAPADGTTLTFAYEFTKGRNYVDLLRGAAGTIALMGSNGLEAALSADSEAGERPVLYLRFAILIVAVVIQCVRFSRGRLALAAPIFFLGGLFVGLQVPVVGICAFAIAWALVPVVPYTPGFFIIQAVVFGSIGTFLSGINLLVIGGVAVGVLPVVLSLLTRRPLLAYSRRPAGARSAA